MLTFDKIAILRPNIAVGVEKIDEILDRVLVDDVDAGAPIEYEKLR